MAEYFVDEMNSGDFFDHIDDLLDFSGEDIDANLPKENCDSLSLPTVWFGESDDSLTGSDSVFSAASDISAELAVPYEDIIPLEWLSNFVEDSFSGEGLTMKKDKSANINEESLQNHYHTSSPVSVLESSSSCSEGEKASSNAPHSPETVAPSHPGRARSKRPRPATFSPRPPVHFISTGNPESEPLQTLVAPKSSSDSENFIESHSLVKIQKKATSEHKKKKKVKISFPPTFVEKDQNVNHMQISTAQPVKKCTHCEITETPQWRAGPMGPKTLCNACGVRYKSGRLYPEYRPAASPTFVPTLHSNSHRKVLEMRNKNMEIVASITKAAADVPELPVLIPNSRFSPDYN